MSVPDSTGQTRRLPAFFALTFALSWGWWIAATAFLRTTLSGDDLRQLGAWLFLPGTIAPAVVALLLTPQGREGRRALLDRIFQWRVRARWYVFAITYVAAIKLVVALIIRLSTGVWPAFGQQAWYVMAGAILISTWVQAGEEVGWRGFALPRLATRFGLPVATVVLGVIWASWHLPLFFIPGIDTTGQSFPVYLLQVIALSVAMGWLYWRTEGSLLLVMVMHAAVNNTKDIVPSAVPGATAVFGLGGSLVAWLTVALLWIAAAYFLKDMHGAKLEPITARVEHTSQRSSYDHGH